MSFKKESKNWKPNLRQKMIKRRNIYQRPKIIPKGWLQKENKRWSNQWNSKVEKRYYLKTVEKKGLTVS